MKNAARLAALAIGAAALVVPATPATATDHELPMGSVGGRVLRPACPGPGNILRARMSNSFETAQTFGIKVRKGDVVNRYRAVVPAGTAAIFHVGRVRVGQPARVTITHTLVDGSVASRRVVGRDC